MKANSLNPVSVIIACFLIISPQWADLSPNEKTTLALSIDISSVEAILLHPEQVLKDIDRFWRKDKAWQLAASWHRNNNIPMDPKAFRQKITSATQTAPAERTKNPAILLAREIKNREDDFIASAIPHILSYLPQNGLQMETTVYLTAYTRAYAFMTNTRIVADVTSPRLGGAASAILNILLHEIYHIGYGINRLLRSEEPLENGRHYFVLDVLHNEGLATYVAWKARDIYPHPGLEDYRMLQSAAIVGEKIAVVNDIFSKIDTLKPDAFSRLSWEAGVKNRAYYIAGAHMARVIDERLGRQALIETMIRGPRSFVSTYNSLAEQPLRVMEFPAPEKLSIYTRIFDFLQGHGSADLSFFHAELADLAERDARYLANGLNNLSYRFLYTGQPQKARLVMEKALSLFPKNANLHDTMGEICMKSGDRASAIVHYRRSLELDSDNINARRYLKRLQAETNED